ncbi:MAG: hypothetical protein IJ785_00210 [Bacteroidales bacterium]|nr:hypothetical protein [Bacteroidales bacterium]
MKKKTLPILGLLFISALSFLSFGSCEKDTKCYIEVTVLDSKNNNLPAPGAWVKIQYVKNNEEDPNNNIVGTISDTGQCDQNGVYRTFFYAPAIFTIQARIDEPDTLNHKFYYRQGERTIRLKEGETVTSTVKVTGDKTLGRADFGDI